MKQENKTSMDLFIFRRREKNITLPLLKSNSKIKKSGLIIGGSFLLFVLFISFILTMQILFNKARKNNLMPFVNEYDNYVLKINNLKKQASILKETNLNLSQAIISIRSGSAILSEISSLIPSEIALTRINVADNKLEIKGIAKQDKGLEKVNIFIIKLIKSKFIVDESVKLIDAKNFDKNKQDEQPFITFLLEAKIVDDAKNINKNYLKSLGSLGLYRRIELIQSSGSLQ